MMPKVAITIFFKTVDVLYQAVQRKNTRHRVFVFPSEVIYKLRARAPLFVVGLSAAEGEKMKTVRDAQTQRFSLRRRVPMVRHPRCCEERGVLYTVYVRMKSPEFINTVICSRVLYSRWKFITLQNSIHYS
jgi:hypothetical protein